MRQLTSELACGNRESVESFNVFRSRNQVKSDSGLVKDLTLLDVSGVVCR